MKIDTCIIVKNEEKTIKKLIEQLLLFSNEIHITDTGSTDNTINIINDFINNYDNIFLHHFTWCMDFSKARNYSFTCYDCKADFIFWCDGDDELNEKLIHTLKNFNGKDDVYYINYQYSSDFYFNRASLLKASCNLKWEDPIHEYINYDNSSKENFELFKNGSCIIHHKKECTEEYSKRNYDIFRNMEKNRYYFTSRNRYYYGMELYYNEQYDCAINQFCKCIDTNDVFILDKINACIMLFKIDDNIGIDYFFKFLRYDKYIRKDMFLYAGNYFLNRNQFRLAKLYYMLCINCEEPNDQLTYRYCNECHIGSLINIGLIEYLTGNINAFIFYNKEVLKIDANNKIALHNLSFIKNINKENKEK